MNAFIFKIVLFVVLFSIGWLVGRRVEQQHLQQLEQQEAQLAAISLCNERKITSSGQGQLIMSNVVISHDYFKYVLAVIRNLLGGRIQSYESVVERARREAIVRLKRQASRLGADQIAGLRLSTAQLKRRGGMIEVFAYGTALIPPVVVNNTEPYHNTDPS
ncbi:YbjQ family protein [Acinetobacter larvae]|uniref:Metal-binding protein n=1 Tax=Acinetobacter larvae TaxID=1789224 RepID=A0A1B2LXG3_9GAMM|nr:heavy metal-binding domain-containing protein [Acinetobacter larvae]AOA57620.1 metal-binding protein [Acinetobacter larvae]